MVAIYHLRTLNTYIKDGNTGNDQHKSVKVYQFKTQKSKSEFQGK